MGTSEARSATTPRNRAHELDTQGRLGKLPIFNQLLYANIRRQVTGCEKGITWKPEAVARRQLDASVGERSLDKDGKYQAKNNPGPGGLERRLAVETHKRSRRITPGHGVQDLCHRRWIPSRETTFPSVSAKLQLPASKKDSCKILKEEVVRTRDRLGARRIERVREDHNVYLFSSTKSGSSTGRRSSLARTMWHSAELPVRSEFESDLVRFSLAIHHHADSHFVYHASKCRAFKSLLMKIVLKQGFFWNLRTTLPAAASGSPGILLQ